ncbi:hypothetical protein [Micromonospora humidisoli]|uniref:Ribbon-helix-helix protein, copG family n=1 Tax=Micromonospora humidisoli TaxID=2807622 RepID=A0ABS2JAI3_9ACTN|nr:hypothetical protein [Micromonospora humidisoli]MBM7083550.1 hypothetical protein [Micromonospora humidisoli]
MGSRSSEDRRQANTEQPRDSQGDHPAGGGGGGGGGGSSLVRVTVNLAPRAVEALDQACEKTRDTKTDTINRALVVYNLVLELLERGGGRLKLETREGQTEIVHIL